MSNTLTFSGNLAADAERRYYAALINFTPHDVEVFLLAFAEQ